MICLGIESTAHTFGIGVVDEKCNVLANEKKIFTAEQGGIMPREAADFHIENAGKLIETALKKAEIEWKEIGLIAYSRSPGLGPCLSIGLVAAKTLSLLHKKDLLGVNHCLAHVEIAKKKTNARDPLVVYASGANTQIIGFENGCYRVFGETLDIGIGNLLDCFGRALGLGFPAGPIIDELYFKSDNLIELPYSVKGMDLVFSGLLTAAEEKVGKTKKEDLAFSLMHTAFAMLTEVSERALMHTGKKELALTGGVAASKALREMLGVMCREQGVKFLVPEFSVCGDNGAMIAWQGILEYSAGKRLAVEEADIDQKERVDQIEVNYMKNKRKKQNSFFDLKPVDFGIGETNAAEEIDEINYSKK